MLDIRLAKSGDEEELRTILNDIIAVGGTTAIEDPLSEAEFADYFLRGKDHISCYVAVDTQGSLAGFQSIEYHSDFPEDWANIATFARLQPKVSGVGTALFTHTKAHAQQAGIKVINATIRADNVSGLSYYDKMGFKTYKVNEAVPLKDGTPMDRLFKKFII